LCILGIDEQEIIGYGNAAYASGDTKGTVDGLIESANLDDDVVSILLAHEPQRIKDYTGVDIVFAGHAHGGQFRIPFINKGLVAPDQGFFPKYTEGRHDYKDTTMYISRGLGNSIIPQRVFNNPEIVKVTLKRKKNKNSDIA
jgi:predicted MPP superfamily phosphohydrolase